jgi:DNA polymerase IV
MKLLHWSPASPGNDLHQLKFQMTRVILHLDLDAFFCAVEEQRDPSLVGRAFAVGGRPEERGVVASCSYAARRHGVHSAMPMARALKICPGLLVISSRHGAYGNVSRQVMQHLWALTDQIEQVSIDEAFLDASTLPEPGPVLARRLQQTIREELGLPCSLGVASNKLVAKIANDVGKAGAKKMVPPGPPNAITVVPAGQEAEFLAPLPVRALWGVGPKTEARLAEMGVTTIAELAAWPEADLARRFGKHGRELALRAMGIDDSPIVTSHIAKSVSQETTFARDQREQALLQQTLFKLSEGVARQLEQAGLCCQTVKLKLRWADFSTITRQASLENPTQESKVIYETARQLFSKVWTPNRPVRLLGVGASGLREHEQPTEGYRQLLLWEVDPLKDQHLQATIASLRQRFGDRAVQLGKKPPEQKS